MSGVLQRLKASKLASKLAGLDWQLLAAKIVVVFLILGTVYFKGRMDVEAKYLKQQAEAAEQRLQVVKKFIPVIERQTSEAAKQEQRLQTKQENYNEQVDKNHRSSECDLSPDELRAFQDLVEG